MELAKELVQQQVFFRRELSERVGWFIGLRWIAVLCALAGLWIGHAFQLGLPLAAILTVIAGMAAYNLGFSLICRYLRRFSPDHEKPFEFCAHGQILCDLSALFALIFFTGGYYSPLVLFVIFHIILAGILLDPIFAYIYSGIILTALGGLGWLQHSGTIQPHVAAFSHSMYNQIHSNAENITIFTILAVAILVTAFLVTTIKRSLRVKGRTLLVFCKELDVANAKLTALYGMIKEMGACTEFQQLMDSATRSAARIMGVKACSIKLLDDQRKKLHFASTHGLSQNYLAKGDIEIDKSPINQKIIEGAHYSIGEIEAKDYFQYPENIRHEGISAMICLPLKVEKVVLGVFCVYSNASFNFSNLDVEFFALVSELTALAMQNLKSELNKSWFLQKAAHQLRSPLNAVQSMLAVLRKAYAGPLNARQSEMLLQCETRIENLSRTVRDLLELSIRRTAAPLTRLHPVHLAPVLSRIAELFRSQAEAKNISLSLAIDKHLQPAMSDEKLLDDVLTNLLSNAVKYSPAGKSVEIRLQADGSDRLRLQVTDQGIGIPEEQIPRLFTEFFRAENAKAFTEEGTGLGMVIVKEAVDRLRGAIQIQSQEGRGTQVICRFPTVRADEPAATGQAPPADDIQCQPIDPTLRQGS